MKSIGFLTSFHNINGTLNIRKELFESFSKKFKITYIINTDNLVFFPKLADKIYHRSFYQDRVNQKLPNNIKLINPKNELEFCKFVKNKQLIAINNFGKNFFELKIRFLLKKLNIRQIYIDNLGGIGMDAHFDKNNLLKNFYYQIFQNLFKKIITPSLVFFGIISRQEVSFVSKKKELNFLKKNFIKNFLFRNQLLFTKKYILVNSRSYDVYLDKKKKLKQKYIVHLDVEMNGRHEMETRGKLSKSRVDNHYFHLNNFLKKISNDFNKPVVVCIHPSIKKRDVKKFKKSRYLKDFKIFQYRTREFIYDSFIVTNFDTSAIVDAAIAQKRIIGLWSKYMDNNQIEHSKIYPKVINYKRINFENFNYEIDKNYFIKDLDKQVFNYNKYLNQYHIHKNKGMKIIDYLKNEYHIN